MQRHGFTQHHFYACLLKRIIPAKNSDGTLGLPRTTFNHRSDAGFTLIVLLIVMLIIALLVLAQYKSLLPALGPGNATSTGALFDALQKANQADEQASQNAE